MNVKSLFEYIKQDQDGFSDLFPSTFVFNTNIGLSEYTTTRDDVMRIDLILQRIYEIEPNETSIYLDQIDVLLYINNIENPLNIVEGMVIRYPSDIGQLDQFRVADINNDLNEQSKVKDQLVFPRKTTRKDNNRQKFIDDGYALPPVVLDTPRNPVIIEGGQFTIGGL
jgi:hypothetical protein